MQRYPLRKVVIAILELREDSSVEERPVVSERSAGARIYLAVGQAARVRVDCVSGAVGYLVRIGAEDITAADGRRHVLPHFIGKIQVGGELRREQLAGIGLVGR